MTESQNSLWGGCAMIVIGVGLIIFGGNNESGHFIELFGFRFGKGESEPMSMGQRWFWGIALVVGGAFLIKFGAGHEPR
jgi:drug/metabolite transporter (DMT)-like permease